MSMNATTGADLGELRNFLLAERAKTLSDTEWKFRMRGYGYHLKRVTGGVMVARLPQNRILGRIEI